MKITRPCPGCGTPLRAMLLEGTKIEVGLHPCPNDACPMEIERQGEIQAHDTRRRAGAVFVLLAALALGYIALEGFERAQAHSCATEGGTFTPVRGLVGLPTGYGVCLP